MKTEAFLAGALEDCLRALKGGATQEDCLRAYPELRAELAPLLSTAAATWRAPASSLGAVTKSRLRDGLMAEVRQAKPKSGSGLRVLPSLPSLNVRQLAPAALAIVAVIALLALLLPLGGSSVARADTVLTVIEGEVSVQTADGVVSGRDGMLLRPGDRVITAGGARAVLTFFDGSTVTLEADTEVLIDAVRDLDGQLTAVLTQDRGQTWAFIPADLGPANLEILTPDARVETEDGSFRTSVDGGGTNVSAAGEAGVVRIEDTAGQGGAVSTPQVDATPADELVIVVSGAEFAFVTDAAGATVGILSPGVPVNQITGASVRRTGGEIQIRIANPDPGGYRLGVVAAAGSAVEARALLSNGGGAVQLARFATETASVWRIRFAIRDGGLEPLSVERVATEEKPAVVTDDAADRARSITPAASDRPTATPTTPPATPTQAPLPTATPRIRATPVPDVVDQVAPLDGD